MKALWPTNICIFYIFWLKYTGWLKFHPDSTVLTTIWPLVTSERSWYRHFRNQQKICFPNVCISPRLNSVFFKIPISVDIGSFDVDLTPKRSKFDQTKARNEILITFSYNIRVQNGDSLWVIFQASALRNRLKLFWNYFLKNPPPVMKLQVLTSRLIPKFSKKSNENLLFELCKVFEFSKMHFWPWKRPKPELLSS